MFVIERRPGPLPQFSHPLAGAGGASALVFGALFLKFSGFDPLAVYGSIGGALSATLTAFRRRSSRPSRLRSARWASLLLSACPSGISSAEGSSTTGRMAATGLPSRFRTPRPRAPSRDGGGRDGCRGPLGADCGHPAGVARRKRDSHDAHAQLHRHLLVRVPHPRPWKDPASFNFPLSPAFTEAARLPVFGDTRIHAGLIFTLPRQWCLQSCCGKQSGAMSFVSSDQVPSWQIMQGSASPGIS